MKSLSVSKMVKNRNYQIDFDKKKSIMTGSTLKTSTNSCIKNESFTSARHQSTNKV